MRLPWPRNGLTHRGPEEGNCQDFRCGVREQRDCQAARILQSRLDSSGILNDRGPFAVLVLAFRITDLVPASGLRPSAPSGGSKLLLLGQPRDTLKEKKGETHELEFVDNFKQQNGLLDNAPGLVPRCQRVF